MISFIIPYHHHPERKALFDACIDGVIKQKNIEICVHETGEHQNVRSKHYKYLFTKTNDVFDRAWNINVGVKHISTGTILVLADSDLIYTDEWFDELYEKTTRLSDNTVYMGFNKLLNLSPTGTRKYLHSEKVKFNNTKDIDRIRHSDIMCAAGGVTVLSRDLMYEVHGIPEDFKDSWGRKDNAFMLKLRGYGAEIKKFDATLYHMYHHTRAATVRKTYNQLLKNMESWNFNKWKLHSESSKEWGKCK